MKKLPIKSTNVCQLSAVELERTRGGAYAADTDTNQDLLGVTENEGGDVGYTFEKLVNIAGWLT